MIPFAVLFAATLMVPAQAAPIDPSAGFSPLAVAVSKAMQEDVETMRVVLARKLSPFAATTATGAGTLPGQISLTLPSSAFAGTYAPASRDNPYAHYPSWPTRGHSAAIEGVYLTRVGVLFSVTLPPTKGDPRMKSGEPSKAESLTDWERAKMLVEGKTPPATNPAARRETPLAESLLKALADNGKNFRELRDDERVMVVVTFRKSSDGDPLAAMPYVGGMFNTTPQAAAIAPAAPAQSSPSGMGNAPIASTDADYDALADIHLKRGDFSRAIEAYTAAVKKVTKDFEAADDAGRTDALKRLRAAYAKVAQAYTLAGQYDNAKAAMDTVSRLDEKGRIGAALAAKPAAPPPLPARLTVSATKRDLVAAAAGKLSFEELGKLATVEYSDPAATK